MARPRHDDEVFVQRCAFIPVRLDNNEREQLGTLIATLKVSEYTDEIDTLSRRNKPQRVVAAISDVCSIATGLAVCANPMRGRKLVLDNEMHADNEAFFQQLFELGRRHKIMNPAKMRGEYGKLVYMLQDAANRGTRDALGFSCHTPLKMVSTVLKALGAADLLWDARILAATGYDATLMATHATGGGKKVPTRDAVEAAVAAKREARDALVRDWASSVAKDDGASEEVVERGLSEEAVRLCVESIDDARRVGFSAACEGGGCYEQFNVAPVEAMLALLEAHFDPRGRTQAKPASLSLCGGDGGLTFSSHGSSSSLTNDDSRPRSSKLSRGSVGDTEEDDDDDDDGGGGYHLENDDTSPSSARAGSPFNSSARAFSSAARNTFGAMISGGLRASFGASFGANTAKLSHDHATQFTFVRQSLLLWREIMRNMFRLWVEADADLLESSGGVYQLWNTGQGLNRVQRCPRVASEMRRILARAQRESGQAWVGLSVVHLGDRDVPNALVFIDKYTQVPRLLAPVAACVDAIDDLCAAEPAVRAYVDRHWAGPRGLKLAILADFFKHAFDGDGDDGGSCIDGRLTSAWNWSSRIAKKPYYPIFLMTGFQGFDGDFRED